jgi:hypothetical protein
VWWQDNWRTKTESDINTDKQKQEISLIFLYCGINLPLIAGLSSFQIAFAASKLTITLMSATLRAIRTFVLLHSPSRQLLYISFVTAILSSCLTKYSNPSAWYWLVLLLDAYCHTRKYCSRTRSSRCLQLVARLLHWPSVLSHLYQPRKITRRNHYSGGDRRRLSTIVAFRKCSTLGSIEA